MSCKICEHPRHGDIERAILRGAASGDLGAEFTLSHADIREHRPHMPASVAESRSLQGELRKLHEYLSPLLDDAEPKIVLGAVRESRELLALEFGTKQKIELSEQVRKLTPEQVAEELRVALIEIERRK